jgi:MFS superfamily sulfate permease-like transporter
MQKNLKITRKTALPDLLAGITCALPYVPQGMGYAVVVRWHAKPERKATAPIV